MAHALEMFLDPRADAAVRGMWRALADAGLASLATRTHRRHRPHVSLTVAESLDGADLSRLGPVLAGPLPRVHLHVLGTFPGTEGALFLGVTVTDSLLAFHAEVHDALGGQRIRHWPYYLPGSWVPHCTLAQDLDRDSLAQAFRLLGGYQPVAAAVTSVGITDTTTGHVTPLTAPGDAGC